MKKILLLGLVGSFIFGLAMQLGGGCGSGTLFTAGSGNLKMMITLAFFILGSLIGSYHFDFWIKLPSIRRLDLIDLFLFVIYALRLILNFFKYWDND